MQGRNGDAEVKKRHVDTAGEGEGRANWEISIDIYTLPRVKEVSTGKLPDNTGSSAWSSVMT